MLEFEFYNEGMNTRGYDVNTRGYDMNSRGYDTSTKGYDVNNKGYDVNTKGYDGRTKEYDFNNTRGHDVSGGQDASACSSSSDLPPEPPPRDYSKHDMDTSCSQEIYELPIPAFHSPVNEDDCSSTSNQLQ